MSTLLYLGHGSYRIQTDDGVVIYVDPFAGEEGYDVPANLILVTHEHFDHTATDKMPHANDCQIIRAADLHPSVDEYNSTTACGVNIQAVQACNKNHPIDQCVGFVLEFDGIKLYASGDTSTTDDMRSGKLAQMELDFALLPGDGFYNMDVAEASECARLINARHAIPIHLVPMDNPDDPSQLFSRERAEQFDYPGRVIVEVGETIRLS